MGRVTASSTLAALMLLGFVDASSADDISPATASEVIEPRPERSDALIPPPPGRVYNTDEVGMIIGGASKDAKAKIGRLPVRE